MSLAPASPVTCSRHCPPFPRRPWLQLAELHKGPLKRKHGLLKRVVRLSHLWLNEYTDLHTFRVKLKTLLWDYIMRHVLAVFRA